MRGLKSPSQIDEIVLLRNSDLIDRVRLIYHSSVAARACVNGSDCYVELKLLRSRNIAQTICHFDLRLSGAGSRFVDVRKTHE